MRAAFLRSDSVETVTLEAIGAATAASKIVANDSNEPGVKPADLSARIAAVLKRDGASTDPATKDMTDFLKRIGPDLGMVASAPYRTEPWAQRVHGMIRNSAGPAEELYKRHFRDSEVPASNPAAHVPAKLENTFQARAQI
ncbi:MAG: hypothetical protein CL558_02605 [Alphaproteobacteria bacterium]|nr:hypothetical protein [Alphaproteobacteria bacterium]MAS49163.1 hypothetical protein [Alphaproteobacteria bacterium]MAX97235.1 hypothetical protein [Alphaproteobacteria bacterium]MBN52449.1 hypothetical protein [Alphaproteobacteria bacterium]OUT39758.1 MAG: hypothetical protein CBB62_15520 [Micavibrio sp. TMED2]|tara:strand:- start:10577 stop:10999 length:423 start_codon:yes stop_codon:yes gene_type:complete